MIPLTLEEVAEITGGKLDGADPNALVSSVVTDSRDAGPGALFVALRGERSDGHAFVRAAAEIGAVGALVADDRAPDDGGAMVRVADPLEALGALAASVRRRLHATVIAITGSSGKTSTRELTVAAVGSDLRTVASVANHNNEIGVPLTILSADETTEALVVEVGARTVGDIARLMPMVLPRVGVVTNVGPAHVGIFGSLENIERAKGELVEALDDGGVAVLNADDEAVRRMADRTHAPVITFGLGKADVRATDIVLDDVARASFTIVTATERAEARLAIPGEHMVVNALAAVAAALAAGVPLESAASGIARCEGVAGRMQIIEHDGVRIVDDTYNANPDSTAAALKALVTMARGRPTWAVLGPMAELGDSSVEEHDRIGRLVARLGVAHLVTVGDDARALHEAARHEGLAPEDATFARTIEEAHEILRAHLEPDAVVLVKASRAAGLERIVEGLLA